MLQETQELVHYLIAMHLSELEIVTAFLNESIRGAVIKNIYRSRGGILLKLYGGSIEQVFISSCFRWVFPVSDVTLFPREPIENREESLRKFLKGQRILSFSVDKIYGKLLVIQTPYRTIRIPLFQAAITIVEGEDIVWLERSRQEPEPIVKPMRFMEPRSQDAMAYESLFKSEKEERKKELHQKEKSKRLHSLYLLRGKVEKDLQKNRTTVEKSSQEAHLLQQWLYSLDAQSRKREVILMDKNGEEQTIKLNPTQTIAWNTSHRFNRVKKARRGIEIITVRLERLQKEIEQIEQDEVEIVAPEKQEIHKKRAAKHSAYHLFRSPTNTLFFVGKGAKDNDELTMKLSSPHDYWFHVQHAHGSHVIMKTAKGKTPTKEQILHGCMLALFYSKAKKSARAEVWYTQRKYLRKPKGAAPGAVIITKGKSLFVVLEQAILDELVKE